MIHSNKFALGDDGWGDAFVSCLEPNCTWHWHLNYESEGTLSTVISRTEAHWNQTHAESGRTPEP